MVPIPNIPPNAHPVVNSNTSAIPLYTQNGNPVLSVSAIATRSMARIPNPLMIINALASVHKSNAILNSIHEFNGVCSPVRNKKKSIKYPHKKNVRNVEIGGIRLN